MAHASSKKILVVDDEPDVRNFLEACLKDEGYHVDTAVDGLDALEKINGFEPDLMTLDMVMPRMSGVKLIRELRKTQKWADLPIIVITAHAHDEFGAEDIKEFNALVSGLRPRITMDKPISPANLIKTIGKILEVETSIDEAAGNIKENERESIIRLLNETDNDTLKKIRDLLNQ